MFSETSVLTSSKLRNIPEDRILPGVSCSYIRIMDLDFGKIDSCRMKISVELLLIMINCSYPILPIYCPKLTVNIDSIHVPNNFYIFLLILLKFINLKQIRLLIYIIIQMSRVVHFL